MLERESVCKIDLDTEPRSKKTDTRRDRHIQNSKSRSAVADRLNSLSLDFFNGIAYDISVETQDGCHITTYLNVAGAVNPNHHEPLCRYQNGSLLFINTKQTPERRMLIHLLLRGFNVGFWPENLDLSGFLCYNMYINYIWSLRDYIRWKSGGWSA